jgi:hypothetical protein
MLLPSDPFFVEPFFFVVLLVVAFPDVLVEAVFPDVFFFVVTAVFCADFFCLD